MAPRPFWKGYLKLSLVTCPVTMAPATSARNKLRFHTLSRKTGHRIESRYVDAQTGKPLGEEDAVKGFPVDEERFVTLTDEELDSVALESTRTIDIAMFVPRADIAWTWHDRPHYLSPDGKVGEEAFGVIRAAMAETGTVGIARLVLYRRERAVMLEPRGKGIIAWTLRYGDEVRDAEAYFGEIDAAKPDPAALRLVRKLIDERTQPWSADMVKDPVQKKLRSIIAAKQRQADAKRPGGRSPRKKAVDEPVPSGNVVSIMDALRRSIASEKKR